MRLCGYVILTISYINPLRNVNGCCLAIDEVGSEMVVLPVLYCM